MNDLIMFDDVLKEKMSGINEKWLLKLFEVASSLEMYDYYFLENQMSIPALEYVLHKAPKKTNIRKEWVKDAIYNVIYVSGLYIREKNIPLNEVLATIASDNAITIIKEAEEWYIAKIKKIQKRIIKMKMKVPRESRAYKPTRQLLNEIHKVALQHEMYPCSDELLEEMTIASIYLSCISTYYGKGMTGYYALEAVTESVYGELKILSRFDYHAIDTLYKEYTSQARIPTYEGSLYRLVINNYLFGLLYGDDPKSLVITRTDAKLIALEIAKGTITAQELITDCRKELGFNVPEKYAVKRLQEYVSTLQSDISFSEKRKVIGELFIVTLPGRS